MLNPSCPPRRALALPFRDFPALRSVTDAADVTVEQRTYFFLHASCTPTETRPSATCRTPRLPKNVKVLIWWLLTSNRVSTDGLHQHPTFPRRVNSMQRVSKGTDGLHQYSTVPKRANTVAAARCCRSLDIGAAVQQSQRYLVGFSVTGRTSRERAGGCPFSAGRRVFLPGRKSGGPCTSRSRYACVRVPFVVCLPLVSSEHE